MGSGLLGVEAKHYETKAEARAAYEADQTALQTMRRDYDLATDPREKQQHALRYIIRKNGADEADFDLESEYSWFEDGLNFSLKPRSKS